ncbi:MAG: hypothetical protein JST30_03445 [Armatimonadetes bacterium]|nr:hypothetical protein [Armatimonadota bacterium]
MLAVQAASVSAVAGSLLTQVHWPCARLTNISLDCASSVEDLLRAQELYAQEHDGRYSASQDWQTRLENGAYPARCRGATGALSYAFNEGLKERAVSEIDDPAETVLIFDADGADAVAGKEALANGRHLGRPTIGLTDGRVRGRGVALDKIHW